MRRCNGLFRSFVTGVLFAIPLAYPGLVAADPVLDPQSVALTVQRMPAQTWAGYGIYLGDGLVLTAAHVAGHGILSPPQVVFAGHPLPTDIVKEGSYPDNDLAVLRITAPLPPELAQHRATVCTDPPRPGASVLVATPEKLTTSTVISPEILPVAMRSRYAASIKDVYTTGNSGSGVFDATSHCLLGIMSSKIEGHQTVMVNGAPTVRTIGIAKHFVPSTDIMTFLNGLPHP